MTERNDRNPAARIVLITGASSGIGRACAETLAAAGYRVYGASRSGARGDDVFDAITMDVTDDASVAAAVESVLAREGRIDVLVNNAGIGFAGAVEDTSIDEARLQMDTNFLGVARVTRAVLPGMRERRSGLIVNIGSIAGWIAVPFQAFYSASKFALEGYSESLRMEMRPFGVRVVVIEPGDHKTPFTANRMRTRESARNPAYRERFEAALATMEHDEQAGPGPEAVALLVKKVIEEKTPSLRHSSGHLTQRFAVALKRVLPGGLFEAIVRSAYKL
jgi:NAD(P)-dependent dehydrogenase (short-subunit alcohol dehydrogenase family)